MFLYWAWQVTVKLLYADYLKVFFYQLITLISIFCCPLVRAQYGWSNTVRDPTPSVGTAKLFSFRWTFWKPFRLIEESDILRPIYNQILEAGMITASVSLYTNILRLLLPAYQGQTMTAIHKIIWWAFLLKREKMNGRERMNISSKVRTGGLINFW